jgi:hypothetical protein
MVLPFFPLDKSCPPVLQGHRNTVFSPAFHCAFASLRRNSSVFGIAFGTTSETSSSWIKPESGESAAYFDSLLMGSGALPTNQ